MNKDDILKLKAVVLYIMKECTAIDYFHLFKILYFAERKQYAEYGQHLVKDTFCALKNGPVPSFLYDAVKCVVGKQHAQSPDLDILTSSFEPVGEDYDFGLKAKEDPDMDELSEAEIDTIDWSIRNNIGKKFTDLSKSSHDMAWTAAWQTPENRKMDSSLIAKAGGASDGFIEYIRERELIDTLILS